MALYLISDIHIKMDGQNFEILMSFLSQDFNSDDEVFLLGDIFDLLIGPHKEYKEIYEKFFDKVDKLITDGIKIHYFEGNHDFHLERLLESHGIRIHKEPFVSEYFGHKILFCHGDEIQLGNLSYKIYKNFIQSRPLNVVANYMMPFKLLNTIGMNASKQSRKRNKNRYGDPQSNLRIKESFRRAAENARDKYSVDYVLCGHSHYKDDYTWENYRYLNCGYLPYTKCFIYFDSEKIEFRDINL